MASSKATVFITGKLSWVKILGEPVQNFNKDGREWVFEVEPNEAGLQAIIKQGLTDRIKGQGYNIGTKGQHKDKAPFIQLKKAEFTRDGNPNTPIRVYDENDAEWDRSVAIGNGTVGDVKLDIRDYGPGKKKGMYPAAIRITDHIPYEATEFGGMDKDEAAPKNNKQDNFKKDFGLDDEIPF